MVTIYPDFYERFACKANLCRHTCCRGWEIAIDDAAAGRYQAMGGALGDEIRRNIVNSGGTWKFRLRKDKCCPFLRKDGFCQLIRSAGKDILGTICANHPRFFVLAGDYELAGTGLSCEKTCELLLAGSGTLQFHEEGSGEFFNLKDLLVRLDVEISAEDLTYSSGMTAEDAAFVLECMEKTEPIDAQWGKELQMLHERAKKPLDLPCPDENVLTRIYQYIFYRALEYAEEYGWAAILSYAQLNTDFIVLLGAITSLDEALRRWSEQIEYSTENTVLLMNRF